MPQEVDLNGTKTTVFTQQELDAAIAGAKTGLLSSEDAQRMADTAAAKARKEAEGKLTDLQSELAKAGNSDKRIAELQAQITEQAGKLTSSESRLTGIKALTKGGLTIEQAEFLLEHPKFNAAKFDTDDATKASIELAKSLGFAAAGATGAGAGAGQAAGGGAAGNGQAGSPTGGAAGIPGVKDMPVADIMKLAGQAMAGERVTLA